MSKEVSFKCKKLPKPRPSPSWLPWERVNLSCELTQINLQRLSHGLITMSWAWCSYHCIPQKLLLSIFLSPWSLRHCVVSKCLTNSRMATCQTWSSVWTRCNNRSFWSPEKSGCQLAVYQVQGHSESSAKTEKVEILRGCLNILWQKDKCLLEKEVTQFHASDFFLLCHWG